MEARSLGAPPDVGETIEIEPASVVGAQLQPKSTPRSRSAPRSRARVAERPKPIVLTREQEYRYIRSDLNRLLITAGILLVAMIMLLVVIEG